MIKREIDYPEPEPNVVSSEETTSFTPNYMESVSHETIRYQLSSDDVLDELKNSMKLMSVSEELENSLLAVLRPTVARPIFLSDLDEDHVYAMSFYVNKAVINIIMEKGDNITHADKKLLINLCYELIFCSLRRPYRGGERGFLGKTQQSREVLQRIAGDEKKKGAIRNILSYF